MATNNSSSLPHTPLLGPFSQLVNPLHRRSTSMPVVSGLHPPDYNLVSAPPGNQPRRDPALGIVQWSDGDHFSDITLRYGHNHEKEFRGHKVILSSSSIWFQRGFLGNFVESEAKEITLKEDDPDALYAMLKWCYNPQEPHLRRPCHWTDEEYRINLLNNKVTFYHITVYQVADKYDCPGLRHYAAACSYHAMKIFLRDAPADSTVQEFREIIKATYSKSASQKEDYLRFAIVTALFDSESTKPIGRPGYLQKAVLNMAADIPTFGADMYCRLVRHTQGAWDTEWARTVKVKCPQCEQITRRPLDHMEAPFCIWCGMAVRDWKAASVR